jgi:two-component system, LytTR family, response regulator
VVATCRNGHEALAAIAAESPDLVFLDIQMPGMSGLELLEALDQEHRPLVVFVTAFDEHAVKAFELHACDYLLKPFERERFEAALARARARLAAGGRQEMQQQLEAVLGQLGRLSGRFLKRFLVREGDRIRLLEVEKVDWIEAAGNYVRLHARGESHLVRATLSSLEERLDPELFLRIHRSTMVNVRRIHEIHAWFQGEHRVVLEDGTTLLVSRRHRSALSRLEGRG